MQFETQTESKTALAYMSVLHGAFLFYISISFLSSIQHVRLTRLQKQQLFFHNAAALYFVGRPPGTEVYVEFAVSSQERK